MNIMIANKSRLLGEGVSMMIKASFSDADILVTDSAKDVVRNLNGASHEQWNVILIDSQISKLISPDRLHSLIPNAKVCLFNAKKQLRTCDEYLKTGYNGVLPESSSSHDLKKAMKALLSGRDFFPEDNRASKGIFRVRKDAAKHPLITLREQEILAFVALGLSNKEIANHLNLAESTIKRHVSNTFKKLDVKNRVEATHFANEKGLLH